MSIETKKTVVACETQPITAYGLRAILAEESDMEYLGASDTIAGVTRLLRAQPAEILLMDKSVGMHSVVDWLSRVKTLQPASPAVVIWGVSISEAEAVRLLNAGAKGVLRKTADAPALLSCFRAVAAGHTWTSNIVQPTAPVSHKSIVGELTVREHQVLELVEQGMKNREIADELGIRPGTVKIHLKHIFEKTGVHGRYGLALFMMRKKGLLNDNG